VRSDLGVVIMTAPHFYALHEFPAWNRSRVHLDEPQMNRRLNECASKSRFFRICAFFFATGKELVLPLLRARAEKSKTR